MNDDAVLLKINVTELYTVLLRPVFIAARSALFQWRSPIIIAPACTFIRLENEYRTSNTLHNLVQQPILYCKELRTDMHVGIK